jgi:carnitine O-acetyltransferase
LLIRFFFRLDGFFDAGMLQQALRASKEDVERPSDKAVRRREIGRRLQLAEY